MNYFLMSKTPISSMDAPHPEWECKQNVGNSGKPNPLQEEAARGENWLLWINILAQGPKFLLTQPPSVYPES